MRIPPSSATVSCEECGWAYAGSCVVTLFPRAATTPCRRRARRIRDRPMPNIRIMLWGVLAAILYLNYTTWLHDYEPQVVPAAESSRSGTGTGTGTGTGPAAGAPANTLADSVPQAPSAAPASVAPASNAASAAPPAATPAASPA